MFSCCPNDIDVYMLIMCTPCAIVEGNKEKKRIRQVSAKLILFQFFKVNHAYLL